MDELICPYCESDLGRPDDLHEPNERYEYQCHNCEKHFVFDLEYSPVYSAHKTPCLNGTGHKWVDVVGHPKVMFEGVKRCKYCGEQNKKPNYEAAFKETEEQLSEETK